MHDGKSFAVPRGRRQNLMLDVEGQDDFVSRL